MIDLSNWTNEDLQEHAAMLREYATTERNFGQVALRQKWQTAESAEYHFQEAKKANEQATAMQQELLNRIRQQG